MALFKTVITALGSDVADNGTFVVSYPAGTTQGTYTGGYAHKLFVNQTSYSAPTDFTVSFGASSITVTWLANTTLVAGTEVGLQFHILGDQPAVDTLGTTKNETFLSPVLISLGAPATASANAICLSQSINTGTPGLLNGATAGVLDVPRAVVAAWTGTAVMTVVGLDVYGKVMTESSASGTSLTGKKAFKSITSVNVSANVTAATVGTGDVLGIPVFLPQTGMVLREMQDGVTATAGTLVKGDTATATATTGDVRGTYDPNAAADGSKQFSLIGAIPDPTYQGITQF
jgi:hypothetical protein